MGSDMTKDARLLTIALRDPGSVAGLTSEGWTALIAMARAEQLIGTLARRVRDEPRPAAVDRILADAMQSAEDQTRAALWEAEAARRALQPLDVPIILLKGTAYAAAGLRAGEGRSIGDLDILVPRGSIEAVETTLLAAGWEWVKPDPYDDAYYRRWMHELPPLIHRDRDRMIDVHHTILPLTARITPDADAMITNSRELGDGLRVLSPADMICHAAAHLLADGDLAGGLRNLWDVHCLLEEFGTDGLLGRARHHGLEDAVLQAGRLARHLYGTSMPPGWPTLQVSDRLFARRLLARDDWGRPRRRVTRFAFYLRSHALRMPPTMLARHLWTKWRKGYRPV